jgi:Protein of unknown function (DUF4235)
MNKLMYKALGLLASLLASMLAGAIFRKVWKFTPGPDEAPEATDQRRGWGEILLGAALQGAIFAMIRAAFDRAAAEGVRKVTGDWPGDERQQARSLAGSVFSCYRRGPSRTGPAGYGRSSTTRFITIVELSRCTPGSAASFSSRSAW